MTEDEKDRLLQELLETTQRIATLLGQTTEPQVVERRPWQIKSFPEGLRIEVVQAARRKGVSVPDFVARMVFAAREAGWMDREGWREFGTYEGIHLPPTARQ